MAADAKWREPRINGDLPEPGQDATPKMLTAYWATQARLYPDKSVSERSRWRLLAACLEDPRFDPPPSGRSRF